MANESKQAPAAPVAPRMVQVTLRQNYGRRLAGQRCEVEPAEYNRLRVASGDGTFTYPVMISDEHLKVEEAAREAADKAALAARRQADVETSTADGWADYQRRAADVLKAQQAEDHKRIAGAMLGKPEEIDPSKQRAEFEQRVAMGR